MQRRDHLSTCPIWSCHIWWQWGLDFSLRLKLYWIVCTGCSWAMSSSFAYLPHMALPMGPKLVKNLVPLGFRHCRTHIFVTSEWIYTVRSSMDMMTSSNGNIFLVTGPLFGEFIGRGEFPTQRSVTRSFDVFFDLRLNKQLSKQPWGWWLETPSWSLWRQCNELSRSVVVQRDNHLSICPIWACPWPKTNKSLYEWDPYPSERISLKLLGGFSPFKGLCN